MQKTNICITSEAQASADQSILFVSHNWGGGIERHIVDLSMFLRKEGYQVYIIRPGTEDCELEFSVLTPHSSAGITKLNLDDIDEASRFIDSFNFERVHLHSLVGWRLNRALDLIECFKRIGLDYDFTVHDYTPVCPRLHMIDWSGVYCNSSSLEHCRSCLSRMKSVFGRVEIASWRVIYAEILLKARRVLVPDIDVEKRLRQYVPIDLNNIIVRPHSVLISGDYPRIDASKYKSQSCTSTTVGLIGGIGWNKGYHVLLALAADAVRRKLPISFLVYGFCHPTDIYQFPNVVVTGRYSENEIDRIIDNCPCDFALFTSVGPETYCYTLDIAFRNKIYPVCFDVGALARRIAETERGTVFPLSLAFNPQELNDRLLRLKLELKDNEEEIDTSLENCKSSAQPITVHHYYDCIPRDRW